MTYTQKSVLLWILSFVLMAALAVYQRATGPTYPVSGKIELDGKHYPYKLLRTHDTGKDAPFSMELPEDASLTFRFKRYKSHDNWTEQELIPIQGKVNAFLPHQPAAGKIEYEVFVHHLGKDFPLQNEPVILRFKGAVPSFILLPHIFFMFFAMVFSIRTGFEALLRRNGSLIFNLVTMMLFLIGGLILGPIVQKYAFDAYWTGWPWGHDLTDNKTLIAFVFWFISYLKLRKDAKNRVWPIIATAVMLAVYLIPHSVLGSEIDHTKTDNPSVNKTETLQ